MKHSMKRSLCVLLTLALLLSGALAAGTAHSYPGITVNVPDWVETCWSGAELMESNLEGMSFADPADEAAFRASYDPVLFYMDAYELESDIKFELLGMRYEGYTLRSMLAEDAAVDATDELAEYDNVSSFSQLSDEAFRTLVQRYNAACRSERMRKAEAYRAAFGADEDYEQAVEEASYEPYTTYICANGKYLRTARDIQNVWMSVEEDGVVIEESWEDIGDLYTIEGGDLYCLRYFVGGEPEQRERLKARAEEIIGAVRYTGASAAAPAEEPKEQPAAGFRDMSAHWAKDEVARAVAAGLFSGVSEDCFSPDAAATRAQLVTALYRMAGSPAAGACEFADVAETDWFAPAVAWAAGQGIVQGSNGKFNPYGALTREELAVMLRRFAQSRGDTAAGGEQALQAFKDQDKISSWAVEAMRWAVSRGLVNGMTADTLVPSGTTTRAQLAVILMRYLDAEPGFGAA